MQIVPPRALRRAVGAVAAAALLAPALPATTASATDHAQRITTSSSPLVELRLKDAPRRGAFSRRTAADGTQAALVADPPGGPARSTWDVVYTGFDAYPQARAAFQAAVDVWARIVSSTEPIKVDATFETLPQDVLGSAGTSRNYSGNGIGDGTSFYPSALADALTASNVSASVPGAPASDITARFTSADVGFYFGTDGAPAADQIDFESVVLHELGHGLGFLGSMDVSGADGSYAPTPLHFDEFTYDAANAGAPLLTQPNNSPTLASVLQSPVFWGGPAATAANGNARPRMYAPPTWEPGSSYSHLDETTYPLGNANSLMTPTISYQEAIHSPGPLTVGIFNDLGWQASLPPVTPPDAPSTVNAVRTPGTAGSADVSWSAAVAHSYPITGYTVTPSSGAPVNVGAGARSATVAGLTNGTTYTFTVHAMTAAGPGPDSTSNSVTPDGTAPTLTVNPVALFGLAPTAVTFSASDTGAGLAGYLVRTRKAAYNGALGGYGPTVTTTATSYTPGATRGYTYCTSVAAVDNSGNTSTWSTDRCTSIPLDDRSLTASAGWRRLRSPNAYGATYTSTAMAGKTLRLANASGRRILIVATTCARCGSIRVTFGGTTRVVSLVSRTTKWRALIVIDFGAVRTGAVTLATRNPRTALVDGLGVSRF